jgi:hypothetical protein
MRTPTPNSTYKKLAVQWLNEALCFVSSSVVADSFRLRNRQLLVAAKRSTRFAALILSNGSGLSGVRSANHRRTKAKQNNGVTSLSPDPLGDILLARFKEEG